MNKNKNQKEILLVANNDDGGKLKVGCKGSEELIRGTGYKRCWGGRSGGF